MVAEDMLPEKPLPSRKQHSAKIRPLGIWIVTRSFWGFLGGTVAKNPSARAGDSRDVSLIPGSRRPCGEGNSNSLQYSCLENSMVRGAWSATVQGLQKSDVTEHTPPIDFESRQPWKSWASPATCQQSVLIIERLNSWANADSNDLKSRCPVDASVFVCEWLWLLTIWTNLREFHLFGYYDQNLWEHISQKIWCSTDTGRLEVQG